MGFTIRPSFVGVPDGIQSFLAGGEVERKFHGGVEIVKRTYRDSEGKKQKGIFACPLDHPDDPKFRLEEREEYVQGGYQYELIPPTRSTGSGPDEFEVLWQLE